MPETVCVTVEQLRDIEVQCDDEGRLNWCPACEKFGVRRHEPDCWLANAIARAERLKDWKPKVGDRVRLKAWPGMVGDIRFKQWDYGVSDWIYRVYIGFIDSGSGSGQWRYLAELMPEEGSDGST